MTEVIRLLLRTEAPVHLGTDEVYEPLGFVIRPETQELEAFEPADFLERLPKKDREQFLQLCREGTLPSLLRLYRFMRDHRHLVQGRKVGLCPGLAEHYQQVLNLKESDFVKQLNRFTIHRTAWQQEDKRPYIPGSAVKGALRTAYLNVLQRQKKITKKFDSSRRLEETLLEGSFATDPFRLVKVSDFQAVGEVKTRVVYAVNQRKEGGSGRGPYQIMEVIEPGSWFVGHLRVEHLSEGEKRLAEIKGPLNFDTLLQSARFFYQQEKKREDQELFGVGVRQPEWKMPAEGMLLRLGRHSGAEAVTIMGHRRIKIMAPRGQPSQYLDHATTLWLAADYHQPEKRHKAHLRPFGWVTLFPLTPELARQVREREEAWEQSRRKEDKSDKPQGEEGPATDMSISPAEETWPEAHLSWNPGRGELTAIWQGRKAFAKDKGLVPEVFHKKLFKERKSITAQVVLDPDKFRILKIEPR